MPRNNNDFVTGVFSKNNHYGEQAIAFGTGQNAEGDQSGGVVRIDPSEDRYITHQEIENRHPDLQNPWDKYLQDRAESHPNDIDDSARQFVQTGQRPLFFTKHTPPVISYMTTTKDATQEAMKAAAHAAEETRRRFGERPWASNNLSAHSAPLVNKAIKSGLIQGIVGKKKGELYDEAQNSMSWQDSLDKAKAIKEVHGDDFNKLKPGEKSWTGWTRVEPNVINTDYDNIKAEIAQKHRENHTTSPQFNYTQGELF